MAILAVVALAAVVQSQFDGSTTGQAINKFVPLTIEITATGAANFVVTPQTIVSAIRPYPLLPLYPSSRATGRL